VEWSSFSAYLFKYTAHKTLKIKSCVTIKLRAKRPMDAANVFDHSSRHK